MAENDQPDHPDEDDGRHPAGLSPAGRQRRQAILRSAVAAAGRRRHRRTAVRAAAAALVLVAAAGVARLAVRHGPDTPAGPDHGRLAERDGGGGHGTDASTNHTSGRPSTSRSATQPATRSGSVPTVAASRPAGGQATTPHVVAGPTRTPATVTVSTIKTDLDLLAELAVPRGRDGWQRIGTDELLRALGHAGLAGGVVVRDGKPHLWFRPPGVRGG